MAPTLNGGGPTTDLAVSPTDIKDETKKKEIMKKLFKTKILLLLALLCCTMQAEAFSFDGGSGTASDPYQIHSVATFENFAKSVYDGTSYEGKYFKQTNDLVFNNGVIDKTNFTYNEADKAKFRNCVLAGRIYGLWTKNAFKGNYDGNNWTIWGLYFGDDMDEPYVGLFGYAENAIIQNLTIRESYMGCKATGTYNDNFHGFFAGYAPNCTFINCHVLNSVIDIKTNNTLFCGGLVGAVDASKSSTTIKNCSFKGTINIQTQKDAICVGGLVGSQGSKNSTLLEGCSVEGTLNVNVDYDYSCKSCVVAGFVATADYVTLNMADCVNRMNFNVYSVNFSDWPDDQNGLDKGYIDGYSHMKELHIYQMSRNVRSMTNCVNLGNVSIGKTDYRDWEGELGIDKRYFIGPIDDLVVAPAGNIEKSAKSCAFYGCTTVGLNGFHYDSYEGGYRHDAYYKLFNLKIYTLAEYVYPGATVSRVLRREDGTSYPDKTVDNTPYLTDQASVPDGVKLYATSELTEVVKDAANVINSFSGYDEADNKTYKWGLMADEAFKGCPAPAVVPLTETNLTGDGTMTKPYLIQDEMDYLYAVSFINTMDDSSGKYFKLCADLDLSNSGKIDPIGSETHPFMGYFNGNGHAITGLNAKEGYMFDVVKGGGITNLTLLDMTCEDVYQCYPLVNMLTDNNGSRGYIGNCYVGGNIKFKVDGNNIYMGQATGFCGTCKGGYIYDSYFKGKFDVYGSGYQSYTNVMGLCCDIDKSESVNSIISNSYSIFSVETHSPCGLQRAYGILDDRLKGTLSDDVVEMKNVYFMYNGEKLQEVFNGTQATSYADIKVGTSFMDGVYNPVLRNTKSYILTNGKGLDAVLADGEGTGDMANIILHYAPSDGEDFENDRYLWQHPNLAVYNKTDDAEYLINCNLDNAKDLQLNMDLARSQTIKANMHYPLNIYHNYNDRPLTKMLCLPVTVQRDALPEGSKLKIVGKKVLSDDKTFISTMVECDSVPAGVPFLAEIPAAATSSKKSDTYDVVLKGNVAPEPVSTISVGSINMETELKGTYVGFTKKVTSDTYKKYREYCGVNDDGSYEITHESSTVSPFQAYAEVESPMAYTRYYYLIDNLLLDDESADVASMLDTYNGKTIGVVLKRTMNSSVWNTVCLPFDLSADEISQAFGENTKVEQLAHVEKAADGGAMLRFEAVTSGMKAGQAYLVKPSKSGSLYSFADKAIKNELASGPADTYYNTYFKGTFAPVMLVGTAGQTDDGYSYNYFIQSNKLYYLPEGQAVPMKGFRGWILIASNSLFGDGAATSARLMHYDGSTTGVSAVEYGKTADGTRIYNLQGMETGEPVAPGVYIKGGKKYVKK